MRCRHTLRRGDSMPIDKLQCGVSTTTQMTASVNALIDQGEEVATSVNAITADPANAVTQIWIPAQFWYLVSGTATLTTATSRLPAWSIPKSAVYFSTAIDLPSHWLTMNVTHVVTNPTANAGNVVLVAGTHNWAIGESINTGPSESSAMLAMGTIAWIAQSSGTPSALPVDPSKTTTVRVGRLGLSGSDTLSNNLFYLGALLTKAS